jgi:hypothetical protein
MCAVSTHGSALEFASIELRYNPKIVEHTISKWG